MRMIPVCECFLTILCHTRLLDSLLCLIVIECVNILEVWWLISGLVPRGSLGGGYGIIIRLHQQQKR